MVPGLSRLSDEPYECVPCRKKFTGPASYVEHRDSEKHRSKLSAANSSPGSMPNSDNFIKCEVCNVEISGMANLEQHDKGRRHQNAVAKLKQSTTSEKEQAQLPVKCLSFSNVTSVCPASPSLASTASGTETPKFCGPPFGTMSSAISHANNTSLGHNTIGSGASYSTLVANHHQDSTPDLTGRSIQTSVHSTVTPTALLQGNDNVQPMTTASFTNLTLQVASGPYQCRVCEKRFMGPMSYKQHSGSCTAVDNFIRCDACKTEISGAVNLKTHDSGKKHRKAMANLQLALAKAQNQPIVTVSVPRSNPVVLASVSTPPCATSLLTVTASGNMLRPLQQSGIENTNFSLRPEMLTPPDSSSDDLDISSSEATSTANSSSCSTAEPQPLSQNGTSDEGVTGDNIANPSQGKDLEEHVTSMYCGETEKTPPVPNFVSVIYNEEGTVCKVGDLKGYACRKCRILLFEDLRAAELHYKIHPELTLEHQEE
ncbi:uncharacterized protein LOC144107768 [Amblyomma americanum]